MDEGLAIGYLVTRGAIETACYVPSAISWLLLYRSRIVPRWIALWGLAAIPFCVAAFALASP